VVSVDLIVQTDPFGEEGGLSHCMESSQQKAYQVAICQK
jgi:hypothetical protein